MFVRFHSSAALRLDDDFKINLAPGILDFTVDSCNL